MLRNILQRNLGGIQGFIFEFNKYADDSNWNEEAKMDSFIAGLNNQVAIKIIEIFPGTKSLLALKTITSRIDARLSTTQKFQRNKSFLTSNRSSIFRRNITNKKSSNNFMDISQKKKKKIYAYCGSPTYSIKDCPKKLIKMSLQVLP